MDKNLKLIGYFLLAVFVAFMLYKFSFILIWIVIAAVLSFIGHPMVGFYSKFRIRRWHLPRAVTSLLALLTIVVIFIGIIAVFVPLIARQAETISRIDINKVAQGLQQPLQWLDEQGHSFGAIADGQTLQEALVLKLKSIVNFSSVSGILNGIIGAAGSFIVGIFSVLFIAFFFIKDENLFQESLLVFVPIKHHKAVKNVINDSKHLLMRYFIGVMLEILCVMAIITLGLLIFGVENALLIGFFGGLMNMIPYLGPIIGSSIALMLGITATLATGSFDQLLPVIMKIGGVLLVANFIDNNILAPLIYSSSVKAHPLEIFFVIIIGGSLAGIFGMLLAIPVYTVLRVIGREFFTNFRIVRKLTQQIND